MRGLLVASLLAVVFSTGVWASTIDEPTVVECEYVPQSVEVRIIRTWYDPARCKYGHSINCSPPWYRLGSGLDLRYDCGTEDVPKSCYMITVSCPAIMSKDHVESPKGYVNYFTKVSVGDLGIFTCADSGGNIVFVAKGNFPTFHVDMLWDYYGKGIPPWGDHEVVTGTVYLEERHLDDPFLLEELRVEPTCVERSCPECPY